MRLFTSSRKIVELFRLDFSFAVMPNSKYYSRLYAYMIAGIPFYYTEDVVKCPWAYKQDFFRTLL